MAGVGPLDMVGEDVVSPPGIETEGFAGIGALIDGPVQPSVLFLNMASFAAISARFCRIISADVCHQKKKINVSCGLERVLEVYCSQLLLALNHW